MNTKHLILGWLHMAGGAVGRRIRKLSTRIHDPAPNYFIYPKRNIRGRIALRLLRLGSRLTHLTMYKRDEDLQF